MAMLTVERSLPAIAVFNAASSLPRLSWLNAMPPPAAAPDAAGALAPADEPAAAGAEAEDVAVGVELAAGVLLLDDEQPAARAVRPTARSAIVRRGAGIYIPSLWAVRYRTGTSWRTVRAPRSDGDTDTFKGTARSVRAEYIGSASMPVARTVHANIREGQVLLRDVAGIVSEPLPLAGWSYKFCILPIGVE